MDRICFFNTAIAWGGGEKWHLEVSEYMLEQGHEVMVVAHKKSALLKKLSKSNIPHESIELTNFSFLNPFAYQRLASIFKKYGVGTIVMNLSRDVKIAGMVAKQCGIQRIIYRRGSAIPIKNTFLNRYLFKNVVHEVLANSFATKKTVLQNNQNLIAEEKITVIYNGIDLSTIQNHGQNEKYNDPFCIVTLGRLEAQKNHVLLVKIAKILKEKGLNFTLIIGGEGRLRKDIEEKIEQLDVGDVVKLHGFVGDPIHFIDQADLFVLPSLWEGFGYVLAEAALCRKPIVAFDLSSNPELIIHQRTGYLITYGDEEGFANAIMDLYNQPKKGMEMGEAGHDHIIQNFDKKQKLQEIKAYLLHG